MYIKKKSKNIYEKKSEFVVMRGAKFPGTTASDWILVLDCSQCESDNGK
jgi:hypothetical protein